MSEIYAQQDGLYLVTANAYSNHVDNKTLVLDVSGGRADGVPSEWHISTAHQVEVGGFYYIGTSIAFHTFMFEGDSVTAGVFAARTDQVRLDLTLDWRAPNINEPDVSG